MGKKTKDKELDVKSIMCDTANIAKEAYEQEEKREQSLLSQAGQMLTAFSFSSAALLMAVPILISNLKKVMTNYIITCMGITMLLFVCSMVLALLVEWRYKYEALPSPMSIFNHVSENADFFNTEEQRDKNWVEMLEATWQSKHKLDDKGAKLIKASMITFFCGLASILLAIIFGDIILSSIT